MNSIEEQLKRTQKELADLKEEYQEFTYTVSHDLKASFRTITGFSTIIAKNQGDSFDKKTKRHFELITKAGNQGQAILDALIEYSRLATKAETFSPIDCNELIAQVKESLAEQVDATNAQIDISCLPEVIGDRQQISLVFYHLVKNALLYQAENNQPRITITTTETKNSWQFCIMDNGIGIRDSQSEHIFKVFKRGVGNEYPGIGMGLAIVKKILERHGGIVWAELVKNKGATFHFQIAKRL